MKSQIYEEGLAVRKKVLGEAYVNAALSSANEFTEPLQDLVTQYCWGHIWTRLGLDLKTRSMITLAMACAINRGLELKAHVRGALRNGVSEIEIREILLQTAIYCGVPAAVESFKLAQEVFAESKTK
jgi:4-carboxymuconolactone decarboxylase